MFIKKHPFKKFISLITVLAILCSIVGTMSLSAFAAVNDDMSYMIGNCFRQVGSSNLVKDSVFGYISVNVYVPTSARVHTEVNNCFVRYAENIGWGQRTEIAQSNSITVSMGAAISIESGDLKGSITSTFSSTSSITEKYTNEGLPKGASWRLAYVGSVKHIEITYAIDTYDPTKASGYRRTSNTAKGYALIYLPNEVDVVKVYKLNAGTSGENIKYLKGSSGVNVNYIQTSSSKATLKYSALKSNSNDVKNIIP